MPRVPAVADVDQKKQWILNAAKSASLELANDLILLQLPHSPPLPRCAARPTAYKMPQALAPDYVQWARAVPRRLEQKHHHASKVLDNKDSKFWEESVGLETGKKIAATGLGDRSQSRPKPYTAMGAQPKSRSAPPKPVAPMAPVEGSKEDVEDKATGRAPACWGRAADPKSLATTSTDQAAASKRLQRESQ
eukprot:Skav222367  [mRNA]  locus=scaffold2692:125205:133641:+ [translate_table: standard]